MDGIRPDWLTPKVTAAARPKPHRVTMTVTPTLALSEGPLSPTSSQPTGKARSTTASAAGAPRLPLSKPLQDRKTSDASNGAIGPDTREHLHSLQSQVDLLTRMVQTSLGPNSAKASGFPGPSPIASCRRTMDESESEIAELRRALVEAEEKLSSIQLEMEQLKENFQSESAKLKLEAVRLADMVKEEQSRQRNASRDAEKLTLAKMNLESYIRNLPSIDEFNKVKLDLEIQNETCCRLNLKVHELKLQAETEKTGKSLAMGRCKALETELIDVQVQVSNYESQLKAHERRLQEAEDSASELHREKNPTVVLESVMRDRDRFQEENSRLRKYVVLLKRNFKKDSTKAATELSSKADRIEILTKELDDALEKIATERDTSRLLRDQVTSTMGKLGTVRKRKEILEVELFEAKNASDISKDLLRLQSKVTDELKGCVEDLHSLAEVSKQLVAGENPDVSMLLGVPSFSSLATTNDNPSGLHLIATEAAPGGDMTTQGDQTEKISSLLNEVRSARSTIAELRELVSNKYAESIADNLVSCNTQ